MLVLLLLLVEKNIIMQSSAICNQAANCQTIPIRTHHQLSLLRVLVSLLSYGSEILKYIGSNATN